MQKLFSILFLALPLIAGCRSAHEENPPVSNAETEQQISQLRAAYAAFNRGDINTAVALFDPQVDWTEPEEFPGGGHYRGVDAAKRYLAQSRSGAAAVISEPERFLPSRGRIVVFVHARVLPKSGGPWQDIRLADVYTFHNGKVSEMRAFADRSEALRWAGLGGVHP